MKNHCRLIAALSRWTGWSIAFLALASICFHPLAVQADPSDKAGIGLPTPPIPDQELPEVMTRGPVHEAFAKPLSMQVQAGLVVKVQPPPIVEETPPEERPQGEQYTWMPGYWAWDGDRNGYLWVSGCWRVTPPDMRWVSGYWSQIDSGWQWIAGFWVPASVQQVQYLPAPPLPEQVEPPAPPPEPDKVWVPSCWYWHQSQYVSRPGYWLTARPDWVWMPTHYVWAPQGYVMIDGHWDYPMQGRGVLFAPVFLPPAVIAQPGFIFSPSLVINAGILTASLFTFPLYSHYCFGDYYDTTYIHAGIYPWFDQVHITSWCDPIFTYDRYSYHQTNPNWEADLRSQYVNLQVNVNLRPARTYLEQESRIAVLPPDQRRKSRLIEPLREAVAEGRLPVKLERISTEQRREIARRGRDERTSRVERDRREVAEGRKPGRPTTGRDSRATARDEGRKEVTPRDKPAVRPDGRRETETSQPARESRVTTSEGRKEVTPRDKPAIRPDSRRETEASRQAPEARSTPPKRGKEVTPRDTVSARESPPAQDKKVAPPPTRKAPAAPPTRKVAPPPTRKAPAAPPTRKVAPPPTRKAPAAPPQERLKPQPDDDEARDETDPPSQRRR